MGLKFIEFEMTSSDDNFCLTHEYSGSSSFTKDFCDFIRTCIKSNKLSFSKSKGAPSTKNAQKEIALIKDFPDCRNLSVREAVHAALHEYIKNESVHYAVVLIIPEGTIDNTARHSKNTWRTILPPDVYNSPSFCTIEFNPIAKTIMYKALKRISDVEFRGKRSLTKSELDSIIVAANGDIRTAIQMMECFKFNNTAIEVFEKDLKYNLFSVLGKLLFNKSNSN